MPAAFFGMECGDNMNNVRVFDGVAYFCLNGGVGCMDMRLPLANHAKRAALQLVRAGYTTANHEYHAMDVEGNPASEGDVTLHLSYPNYNNEPLKFVFRLSGGGVNAETVSAHPEVTYSSLSYGSYTFTARVCTLSNKSAQLGPQLSLGF